MNIQLAVCALALLSSCGNWGGGSGDGRTKQPDSAVPIPSSAAKSTILPVGSPQCPYGGISIDSGPDANGNGVLDASEVSKSSPICNGVNSTDEPNAYLSLVKIESEPTGTWCPAGGLRILAGSDLNRNGLLDPADIVYTDHLCTAGTNTAAGIVVAAGPPAAPAARVRQTKKPVKPSPSKKTQAKPVPTAANPESSSPATAPPPEPTEVEEKARPSAQAKRVMTPAPRGWTELKLDSPNLAKVTYKMDGKSIIVRFNNISENNPVRFTYTVRWKGNQNGRWVDDSTVEGISFRLDPQEQLDREIRTQAKDVKDIVVNLSVVEVN